MTIRNKEITDSILSPVYSRVRDLHQTLGYEIPIFQPGRPAVQSVKESQILMVVNVFTDDRTCKTLGGGMWQTDARYELMLSVPEKVPGTDVHRIAVEFSDGLVNYYTDEFCNDVEQSYIDSVYWDTEVDELNRTEYTTTVVVRYFDYPTLRGV